MRIRHLKLKNIGPFKNADMMFFDEKTNQNAPITIITGENGTGKTIILDAIRALLLGYYFTSERNIVRTANDFLLSADFSVLGDKLPILANEYHNDRSNNYAFKTNQTNFNLLFANKDEKSPKPWIVNYWTSKVSSDSFELKSLVAHNPKNYLTNALNGIQSNIEVTELICFFDYLKSSDSEKEKATGEFLFDLLKKIIKISLLDGEFKYVERQTLTPIIAQGGSEVSLDKLSSGNLYLIQRLVSLLGQMYSVHLLYGTELTDLCKTEGLLLIDEAENHLHPKWQKTFLNAILSLFPNLQIIVTTHSPFIVSSVKNAKVFVCKSMRDHSIVEDKTEDYANKPVEEILLSPAFETNSFSAEISDLLAQRKLAIAEGNKEQAKSIEKLLQEHNPTYFSFFDIDDLLQKIARQ